MFIKKFTILAVVALVFVALQPLTAQTSSDSARLEKLERAVEQLQKRNAELESEVNSLKKQTASAPTLPQKARRKRKSLPTGRRMSKKMSPPPRSRRFTSFRAGQKLNSPSADLSR